jgi:hypothetical protein
MNPSTLVFAKGLADIGVGLILFAKPTMLYESVATKTLSSLTGLVHRTVLSSRSIQTYGKKPVSAVHH